MRKNDSYELSMRASTASASAPRTKAAVAAADPAVVEAPARERRRSRD
jgi:hypothetical protein